MTKNDSKESIAVSLANFATVETDEKKELAIRRTNYEKIVEELRDISVTDDEDYEYVSEILKTIKTYYREIETRRKRVTDPLNLALKEFRSWYSPALNLLEEGERLLKDKLGKYALQKEAQREAQMRKIAEASSTGDFDAAHQAAQGLVTAPSVKGISVSERWEYEIEDLDSVPREFMTLDHSAVKIHIRNAGKDDPEPIKGLRFYKVAGIAARTSVR